MRASFLKINRLIKPHRSSIASITNIVGGNAIIACTERNISIFLPNHRRTNVFEKRRKSSSFISSNCDRSNCIDGAVQPISSRCYSCNQRRNMSSSSKERHFLADVPLGPIDPILGMTEIFEKCSNPRKVNVCVGAYRDALGKPWVLPSVRQAEQRLLRSQLNKEYAPIAGDPEFLHQALKFAYGDADSYIQNIASVQALGGTGACRIGGEFLARFLPKNTPIYIPEQSWENHHAIFHNCGLDVHHYSYYDRLTNGLDYLNMVYDIQRAPPGSILVLHASAHNPTGCDPSPEQWAEISDLVKQNQLHPLFDMAYQGFASGNSEADAHALRLFASQGHKIALCQSFSKNFGLYNERCGAFSIICDNPAEKEAVLSQLKLIIRPMYSNPPTHGSKIVNMILSDKELRKQYDGECFIMANRIKSVRELLVNTLEQVGSTHDWSFLTKQIGMFAYTGMTLSMSKELIEQYSIFCTREGRISLPGLNVENVGYVADAIHAVTDGQNLV